MTSPACAGLFLSEAFGKFRSAFFAVPLCGQVHRPTFLALQRLVERGGQTLPWPILVDRRDTGRPDINRGTSWRDRRKVVVKRRRRLDRLGHTLLPTGARRLQPVLVVLGNRLEKCQLIHRLLLRAGLA